MSGRITPYHHIRAPLNTAIVNLSSSLFNKVEVRKDDKTVVPFEIEFENYVGPIVSTHNIGLMNSKHEVETHKLGLVVKK